jgi:hypothetical protein
MTPVSIDTIVVVAFAALLALVATLLLRTTVVSETQEVRRRLQCPLQGRPADCVLVRDVHTGRLTSVAVCSLRASDAPPCSSECAKLLEAGADLRPRPKTG